MNPAGRQRQCAHAVHRILAGRSVLHGSLFREALGIYGHGAHAGIATWPWNMESLKVNEPPKWVDMIKDDQGSLWSLAELLERAVERGRERSKNPSSYILLPYIIYICVCIDIIPISNLLKHILNKDIFARLRK